MSPSSAPGDSKFFGGMDLRARMAGWGSNGRDALTSLGLEVSFFFLVLISFVSYAKPISFIIHYNRRNETGIRPMLFCIHI